MLKTKQLILACLVLALGLAVGFVLTQVLKTQNYPVAAPWESTDRKTSSSEIVAELQEPESSVSNDVGPSDDFVACPLDAMQCPDGSFVGRSGPSCTFECKGVTPKPNKVLCTQEQKKTDVCIEIYAPVCAQVQVECITTPCNPVPQTFPNSCFACSEDRVISYVDGSCGGDELTI